MTKYLWFDIETTGLDVRLDRMLEIGALMCDEHMSILDTFTRVQWYPKISQWGLDQTVMDMHTESGLLDVCRVSRNTSESETWELFGDWVESWRQDGEDIIPCGSGILHFDLPYIKANAPHVADVFTYYGFDVGVLRRMVRWGNPKAPSFAAEPKAHRALDDARDHLVEFMGLMEWLRVDELKGSVLL